MLCLADYRFPSEVLGKLGDYERVIPFQTSGLVYDAISGHPDIFFCQTPGGLVHAPNTPHHYLQFLNQYKIKLFKGNRKVGKQYPATAVYNAVATDQYLIHNLKHTDELILAAGKGLKKINVDQGYVRCNLMPLPNNSFITSDKGIEKTLLSYGLHVLYVDPTPIRLAGFAHGFFGGCCGTDREKFFISGGLSHFSNASVLRAFIEKSDLEVIELYQGPPIDGGSLLFS
ncbi:MAG: hypothetical protein K9I94_03870 [Bacteroidales bacterium]|nr:hypothetical protein [Bacteroidales bacterium]